MLARRFFIVCLMTIVFGMGFSIIVAENARSKAAWGGPVLSQCASVDMFGCRFDRG